MDRKIELLEELRKLDAKIQVLREKEGPTPEDVEELNSLCDQVEEIDAQLKVEERAAAINKRNQAPAADPPAGIEEPGATAQKGFGVAADASDDERYFALGTMLQAVARAALPVGQQVGGQPCGVIDHRLLYQAEQRAPEGLAESTPSLGGFLVGTDFSGELLRRAYNTSIIFNKVRKITIGANSNALKINYLDETSRADGSRLGGIRAYWEQEAGEKTASAPKFGKIEISLNKLIGLLYSTDELLQDATALGSLISQSFAEEFGFKIDDSLLNGTGAGQPLGILNASSLVTIAKETGQNAKTVIWDNIQKMYAQIWAPSLIRGEWLINQSVLIQLMSMTIPVGTGGIPVWLPANLAQGRPNTTLMGMPLTAVEQAQTLGTKGDIYLCDWSQYLAITKGGMQSASSIHVKFTTDQSVFRFVTRLGGQPTWQSSLKPFKDASTSLPLGPFLTLAVRS